MVAAIAVNVVAFASSPPACGSSERTSATSPDRRWRAVVYYYACGVLSDEYMSVALVPAGSALPAAPSDVFAGAVPRLIETERDEPLRVPEVSWDGDGRLRVRYDLRLKVETLARIARGIPVDARPFE